MKYNNQGPRAGDLLQAMAHATPMAQVIILTIDGQRIACLGPVIHAPHAGLNIENIQGIEFGEIIPTTLAAQLMSGEFFRRLGVQ